MEAARRDARAKRFRRHGRDTWTGDRRGRGAPRRRCAAEGFGPGGARLNKVYFAAEDTVEKALVHKLLMNYFEQDAPTTCSKPRSASLACPLSNRKSRSRLTEENHPRCAQRSRTQQSTSHRLPQCYIGSSWLRRGGPRAGGGANSGPSRAARDAATANGAEASPAHSRTPCSESSNNIEYSYLYSHFPSSRAIVWAGPPQLAGWPQAGWGGCCVKGPEKLREPRAGSAPLVTGAPANVTLA